ncbi:MAG: right-handed parallel beta-helix repeat-containing protein [Verrucomicrobiales bacterium]
MKQSDMQTYHPDYGKSLLLSTLCLGSLAIGAPLAQCAELVVGPDAEYAQIQEAVDAANPGDRILVHTGIYSPVVIAKDDLVIAAASPRSLPIVDAGDSRVAVELSASGVEIRGIQAQNALGEEDNEYAFLVTGDNNRLVGNTAVTSIHGFGLQFANGNILLRNVSNGNVTGFETVVASDNHFKGNSAGHSEFIGFFEVASNGNEYVNNTADNGFVGFFLPETSNATLIANGANGNVLDGCNIVTTTGVTLIENDFSDNGRYGIRLRDVSGSFFNANKANGNGLDGIALDDVPIFDEETDELVEVIGNSENVFRGNQARGNEEFGVFVDEESFLGDNDFRGTSCSGNGLGGSNIPGLCEGR